MLDPLVTAALEDVCEAHQVGVHIGEGILDRVTHPRLRGQIHHPLGPVAGEGVGDRFTVLDVDAQVRIGGVVSRAPEAGLL